MANILRSCGRMFWPAYYLIVFASLYGVIKGYKKYAWLILSIGLCIQIADTSAGWWAIHQKLKTDSQKVDIFTELLAPMNDPFWNQAPAHYSSVVLVPVRNNPKQTYWEHGGRWEKMAAYALQHQMATNSVYLARPPDQTKLNSALKKINNAIATGQYDPHSLYIVDDEKVLPILMHLDASKDLFAKINGVNVLAPGWKTCRTCPQVPAEMEIHSVIPPVILGQTIHFSRAGQGKYFLVGIGAWPIVGWGWSYPEAFGTWSEGKFAKIVMPLPEGAKTLTLEMRALISPSHPQQTVGVYVDRQLQQTAVLSKDQGNLIEIVLPPKAVDKDYVTIELRFNNQAKPKDLGLGDDIRDLAIGLVSGVVR
jgi:hypothetical protein